MKKEERATNLDSQCESVQGYFIVHYFPICLTHFTPQASKFRIPFHIYSFSQDFFPHFLIFLIGFLIDQDTKPGCEQHEISSI